MSNIDTRSESNFLIYADSVNRARAIPLSEDNLKPIHRKILYTFYLEKLTSDKNYAKSMATVGDVMKLFSPHGDSATYGALARLAQSWKLRYPLVDGKGNFGSLLDDRPAAARYTDARLSKIGELMLEDVDKNCVPFVPNYDSTTTEPAVLPSKFPFILCGNNEGIGVSLSSDIVSHNFTEVRDAINYYLDHVDTCTIADLMKFIKGPDFPTGGRITNGEDLYKIYSTGQGVLKMEGHYDIVTGGLKPQIVFHDVPYGVQIEDNVINPIKEYVINEDFNDIENVNTMKVKKNRFDIVFTLAKKANVAQCLNIILSKTKLATSVKVNNTFVVNNEMKCLNLKEMVATYVNSRSEIIKKIAVDDYGKTNHKLTIVIGLQKCMSNIDRVIAIIRGSESSAAAKIELKKEFELTDEQATAVLDMKLGKLSHLDVQEIDKKKGDYEKELERLHNLVVNEKARFAVIKNDLYEIKKIVGEDSRLTEITYNSAPTIDNSGEIIEVPAATSRKMFYTNASGLSTDKYDGKERLIARNYAYGSGDIICYNAEGDMGAVVNNPIGAFAKGKNKLVTLTKNGNIKVSLSSVYKFSGKTEKMMKVKDGDSILYAALVNDNDFVIICNKNGNVLKLAVKDLTVGTKLSVGLKTGFEAPTWALAVEENDELVLVGADNKVKVMKNSELSVDKRGNKGQAVGCSEVSAAKFFNGTDMYLYTIDKKMITVPVKKTEKLTPKSKAAGGTTLTLCQIKNIL